MAAGLVMGLSFAVLNLVADLLCFWLDPRLRAGRRTGRLG